MDELAVVQPHGSDRLTIATTSRRTNALIAVTGWLEAHDATGLGILVRNGGSIVNVAVSEQPSPVVPRSRRFRLVLVAANDERPFPQAWNEAMLRWQRSGSSSSTSVARS
jgi:hypothetical protein